MSLQDIDWNWAAGLFTAAVTIGGFWWKWGIRAYRAVKSHFSRFNVTCEAVAELKQTITKELTPNGGGSMKDTLTKVAESVAVLEGRHQAAMSHMPYPVWFSDAAGECTWINRAYVREFGRDFNEVKDSGWLAGVATEDRHSVLREWELAVRMCSTFSMQYGMVTADGDRLKVHAEAIPVMVNGNPAGYVGTLQILEGGSA